MATLALGDPLGAILTRAVQDGDLVGLGRLLAEHDGLASARVVGPRGGQRTPLHLVTDWPGYFPNGADVVRLLLAAGADPDAPMLGGRHAETPLHWAASSDDLEVAEALVDGGADVEVPGAGIGGGAPLVNAVAYGCWHVARLLVAHGAVVDTLWQAAALGMAARVDELLAADPPPSGDDLNHAFWQACHGGQRRMAERLLALGADVNWTPDHSHTPLDVAAGPDTRRQGLADWLHERGALPAPA